MKRICLIMLLICLNITMMAQREWTVKTVPNTRLESNDIHVSDPDDFLSDSAEMRINTALCAIRDKADVFLVTLASIGDAEPRPFATELLNYWGIGDAEANNGVLLLFVKTNMLLSLRQVMVQRKPSPMQGVSGFSPIPLCLFSERVTMKADFVRVWPTSWRFMVARFLQD